MKKLFSTSVTILTVVIGLSSLEASVSLDRPAGANGQDAQQNEVEELTEVDERFGFVQPIAKGTTLVKGPLPSPSSGLFNLVECYSCSDCRSVLPNTTTKICPYTLDPTKTKCVVYAEQYKHMNRPWYIRGCSSERGSCVDIRKAHSKYPDIVKLLNCFECDGDKCNTNGTSRSLADITMAFFALVVTPLLAKYTLS